MSDCASPLQELLSGYLDGELTPDEARRVEAHLQDCASCTAELRSLRCAGRTLRRTIGRQADAADFGDFPERVLARIGEAGPAPAGRGGAVHWLRDHRSAAVALAAAAILLLALLLGPLLFPGDASAPAEADVVVELIDPPDGYDAMIFNEDGGSDEGKNITVIWLFEQDPEPDTDTSKEPSL